jgi:arylsulfatase A-like enzyme
VPSADGPIARVNGEELGRADFQRQMDRTRSRFERAGRQIAPALEVRLKENLIRKMIDDELIRQKAMAEGVAVTAEGLAEKLAEHKSRFGTDEAFASFLERTQQGDDDVRSDLERNLLRDLLFAKLMQGDDASDDDAKAYYEENKDRYYEGRHYSDEWDKAVRARGLVKPHREAYRQHPDDPTGLGAFDWELPEDLHSDFFVGDMATWWLETKPKPEGPLFMQIGFPGPHPPYDPPRRYAEPYLRRELPLATVTEEQISRQPPPFQEMRIQNSRQDKDSLLHLLNPTREQVHRQRAYYLANVTMIDEKVGEILETLDTQGYLDNAVVIFTSDHGDALCDYGHSQKMTFYDIITRVPTIVWAPGRFEGGRRLNQLCQLMDLGPTVLELAGVEPPAGMEAVSLLPALEGEAWAGRDYVFTEQPMGGSYMTMVRNARWKMVHFMDRPFGELFDLEADPQEVDNRWDDPALASVKQEMIQELCNWRIRSALHTAEFAAEFR